MLEFITKFFRREEASKTLAKERLRLVLMSDRVSLAPDVFDEMKNEMLAVIRRYLEIDERALDMHFENFERQFALLASIPVLKVKTAEQGGIWRARAVHTPAHRAAGANGAPRASGALAESVDASTEEAGPDGLPARPAPRRRRRRRRTATPQENGATTPAEATGEHEDGPPIGKREDGPPIGKREDGPPIGERDRGSPSGESDSGPPIVGNDGEPPSGE